MTKQRDSQFTMQTGANKMSNEDGSFKTIIDHTGRRRRVLRDGMRYRARGLLMMDSQPRDMRPPARRSLVRDGYNRPHGLSQPGFRRLNESDMPVLAREALANARQRTADSYAEYDRILRDSWRNPNPGLGGDHSSTGVGERGSTGAPGRQIEGTPLTDDGWPSVFRRGRDGDADRRRYEEGPRDEDDDNADNDREETEQEINQNTATHPESSGPLHGVDATSFAQMMRDHQNKMVDIYRQLDHELTQKWRQS